MNAPDLPRTGCAGRSFRRNRSAHPPDRKHFDIEASFAKPGKVGLTVPGELRDILPREDSLDDVVVGVHNQGIEVEFPVIALTGAEPHDRPEKDEREGRSQQTLSE